ncbi:hypothetical protein SAMN05444266_11543 [Chitinophaga jiangningensis]|uniref:Uncharacterized protein n=1 Tax=Chitinophaga jiangningensis TaxID=1419482 RepID=A0A1M7MX23_9BACT|nr:hypothetical protein [Chitinophaga jiangningensis]SHM95587.1 hypothetical protein SAMN05444266_11543 [Chitinophaga jiangningensis]
MGKIPDMKQGIIPEQTEGGQSNTSSSIRASSDQEARAMYNVARERLLDVNNWHNISGDLTATFELISPNGEKVYRHAKEGDHIRINIPGPGTSTGAGYDWVRVEKIEEQTDHNGVLSYLGMRVRPFKPPKDIDPDVAHFFQRDATSSFILTQYGAVLEASVLGRNEKPNTDTSSFWDRVRNFFVGLGAMAGLSKAQWKALVKGIIRVPGHSQMV